MKNSNLILLTPYLLTLASFMVWMLCVERSGHKVQQEAKALIQQFNNTKIHVVHVQNMNQPVVVSLVGRKRLHIEGVLKSFDSASGSLENSSGENPLNVEGGVDSWSSTKSGGLEYVEGHISGSKDYKGKRILNLKEGVRISNDTLYLDGTKYRTYGMIRINHPDIRSVVSRNNPVPVVFEGKEVINKNDELPAAGPV